MARWDIAEWVGPTVNEGDGDGRPGEPEDLMYECRGLILHIMQGTYGGSIAWAKNPDSDVSFHFANAKDARLGQLIDTSVRAWTQGAGNGHWLSVENEGYAGDELTPPQLENVAQLYARGVREYGWPLQITDDPNGRGLGWHGMGGQAWGGHFDCPGEPIKAQRAAILARAEEILNGDDVMSKESEIDGLNTSSILFAIANGADEAIVYWRQSYDDHVQGTAFKLSLLPYWKRAGVDVDEQALAGALASNAVFVKGIGAAVKVPTQAELEQAAFVGSQRAEDE